MNHVLKTALISGITGLLIAGSTTFAAEKKAAPAEKAPKKAAISQNPYLGAIVVEASTGKVLFEDKADAKGFPASMQKLMDLLIILEKIEQKQLTLQDQVPVSAKSSKTGGSQVYLKEKESFTIDEMLYALMVQSANDAAVALAEKVAGTTEGFVELMNKRAQELGMVNSVFHSVHGLPPGEGQEHDVTTARDFALLCREVVKHKEALRYTSTTEHVFRANDPKRKIEMRTHDHLLGAVEGVDGLKTGYFTAAGYSIAITSERKGQRIIAVVLDSTDRKVRDAKATELVAKGFAALPAPAPVAAATGTTPASKK